MELIQIWEGFKGTEDSDFITIEFLGVELGSRRKLYGGYDDNRGTSVRIFRTEEDTIVFHWVEWSNYDGDEAYVYEYQDLNEAAEAGWRHIIEEMNLGHKGKFSLKEWRERKQQKK